MSLEGTDQGASSTSANAMTSIAHRLAGVPDCLMSIGGVTGMAVGVIWLVTAVSRSYAPAFRGAGQTVAWGLFALSIAAFVCAPSVVGVARGDLSRRAGLGLVPVFAIALAACAALTFFQFLHGDLTIVLYVVLAVWAVIAVWFAVALLRERRASAQFHSPRLLSAVRAVAMFGYVSGAAIWIAEFATYHDPRVMDIGGPFLLFIYLSALLYGSVCAVITVALAGSARVGRLRAEQAHPADGICSE